MKYKNLLAVLFILLYSPLLVFSQTTIHQYYDNPVFSGTTGEWDSFTILRNDINYDGEKYHMFYTARASSWDYSQAAYTDVGYATSLDGINWEKDPANPIFTFNRDNWEKFGIYEPIILRKDDKWHMWYVIDAEYHFEGDVNYSLGYAYSDDGTKWIKNEQNLNLFKSENDWDQYCIFPKDVIYNGSKFLLYYVAIDTNIISAGNLPVGVAESDDGLTWVKDTLNNPILNLKDYSQSHLDIWNLDVVYDPENVSAPYQLWFNAFNETGSQDKIFYATSLDGKNLENIQETQFFFKHGAWSGISFEDIEVVKVGDKYQYWLTGYGVGTTSRATGYFEDFTNGMYLENTSCSTPFNDYNIPPDEFQTEIINPSGEEIEVWGRIECDETSIANDYLMSPISEGSNIYKIDNPVVCSSVNFYTYTSFIKNSNDDTLFNSRNFNIESKFTTAGPIRIQNFETETVPIDDSTTKVILKNIEVKNEGAEKSIPTILLRISEDNDNVIEILNGLLSFGILDPQESRTRSIAIAFSASSNSEVVPLNVEFSSSGVVYWGQELLINLTGIEDAENLPTEYALTQNYPNPFNPSTTIKYSLPSGMNSEKSKVKNVKLVVFDLLGREVTSLVNEKQKAGYYEVAWDAINYPSGVYFYKLTAGEYTKTKKMLLIK